MFIDPGFGGTGDQKGVCFRHPRLEVLFEVIQEFLLSQSGVDLASDVFEVVLEVLHQMTVHRESWVEGSVGWTMVWLGCRKKPAVTVTHTEAPALFRFGYETVRPRVDRLQAICRVLGACVEQFVPA